MNPDDIRGLSVMEQFAAAASYAGVKASTLDGIWDVESARGQAPKAANGGIYGKPTRWGVAEGPFQILPSTLANVNQALGRTLDPQDFTDGLVAAAYIMRQNLQRFGTEDNAILAYHGGWDTQNWGPTTRSYLQKVLGSGSRDEAFTGRQGLPSSPLDVLPPINLPEGMTGTTGLRYADPDPSSERLWGSPVVAGPGDSTEAGELWDARNRRLVADGSVTDKIIRWGGFNEAAIDRDTAGAATRAVDLKRLQAAEAKRQNTSFGDIFGASYNESLRPYFREIMRTMGDRQTDQSFLQHQANEGFRGLQGYTVEEQELLLSAQNPGQLALFKHDVEERRANQDTISQGNLATQIGLGLGAELLNPVNYVAGVGTSAAFGAVGRGSWQLARQGRLGAALGSSAAEGALGNIAIEGLLDALGETRTIEDYMASGALGAVLNPAISYRGLNRSAVAGRAMKAAEDEKAAIMRDAMALAGPDADEASIRAAIMTVANRRMEDKLNVSTVPDETGAIRGLQDPTATRGLEEPGGPARRMTDMEADKAAADSLLPDDLKPLVRQGIVREVVDAEELVTASPFLSQGYVQPDPQAKAVYVPQDDTVYIVRNNLTPEDRANIRGIVAHEVGVHFGLERTVGPQTFDNILSSIMRSQDPQAVRARQMVPEGTPNYLKAEEALGYLAELNPNSPLLSRLISGIRNFLRDNVAFFRGMEVTTQDALAYIRRSTNRALDGRRTMDSSWPYVWHGSAVKDIDQLSLDFFATGEGGGFFGWGHYVTSERGTAIDYRNKESIRRGLRPDQGGLYRLRVNANQADMMPWDGPADARALAAAGLGEGTGKDVYDALVASLGSKRAASEALLRAGIQGVRYTSGRTRDGKASVTNSNYVLFSDDALQMDLRYSMPQVKSASRDRGLDMYPVNDQDDLARRGFIEKILDQSDTWAQANPRDKAREATIMQNSLFDIRTPGLTLAASENNVARWAAGNLVEVTTRAAGNGTTAAIAASTMGQRLMGNTILNFDNHFRQFAESQGHGMMGRAVNQFFGGDTLRTGFMREVALYREAIYYNRQPASTVHPSVVRASEALDVTYKASLEELHNARVAGFEEVSYRPGYMPHIMNPSRLVSLTTEQQRGLRDILRRQFRSLEGMDDEFATYVADRYLAHARTRASGAVGMPGNVLRPESLDWVIDGLRAQGVPQQQLKQLTKVFANKQNKRSMERLTLDLNEQVSGDIVLADLFYLDQLDLVRNYVRKASGDVALARKGVMGEAGLQLLREAMQFGGKVTPAEWAAFDQISMELTGRPFGDSMPGFLEGAMTMNAATNLGMTGVVQIADGIRTAVGMGVMETLRHSPDFARMIKEVGVMARGGKVDNPILGSMELPGGTGEFGLEGHKMVTSYDSQSALDPISGEAGWLLRATRAAGHNLGIVSFARRLQAAQRRVTAMQYTSRALRAARDGRIDDPVLLSAGFTPELLQGLQNHLLQSTVFGPDGWVKSFDIQKVPTQYHEAFMQAVHRGSRQMIQGAWIGERNRLQYDNLGRIMGQFRNYPMLAMEKQWARDRATYGAAKTLMMATAMAGAVLPLYLARVGLQAVGRPEEDREDYLERALSPVGIGRGVMNYIAWLGLAPDVLDGLATVGTGVGRAFGAELPAGLTGTARNPGGSVLSTLAPGAGYLESVGRFVANPSLHGAARVLPFSNTPLLYPAVNLLREDAD